MDCFDEVAFGEREGSASRPGGAPSVDVAGRLRGMWT
jgi:hypothetical protein